MCGVKTNVVTAVEIHERNASDRRGGAVLILLASRTSASILVRAKVNPPGGDRRRISSTGISGGRRVAEGEVMLRSLERSAAATGSAVVLFYVADGSGGSSGPFTIEQLAGSGISGDALVWSTGFTDWLPASSVAVLASAIAPAAPAPFVEGVADYQPVEYAAPRTQSYGRAGRGAWRAASPSAVLLGLMLFFLPWVEVRCNFGGNNIVLVQQSGVQTCYGGASPSAQMEEYSRELHKQAEREDKADGGKRIAEMKAAEAQKAGRLPPAFLVILAAAAAVVGGIIALQPRRSRSALTASIVCAGGAAALLLIQIAVGFPVRNELMREFAKGSAGVRAGEPNPAALAAAMFQFGTTPWFWLAVAAFVAAAAFAGAELMIAGRHPRRTWAAPQTTSW
jgi:hypothetical protein